MRIYAMILVGLLMTNCQQAPDDSTTKGLDDSAPQKSDSGSVEGEITTEACNDEPTKIQTEKAYTQIDALSRKIPGVLMLETGPCSEVESDLATPKKWVCGVMHYFKNVSQEEAFRTIIRLNGSTVETVDGVKIPLCSRTAF